MFPLVQSSYRHWSHGASTNYVTRLFVRYHTKNIFFTLLSSCMHENRHNNWSALSNSRLVFFFFHAITQEVSHGTRHFFECGGICRIVIHKPWQRQQHHDVRFSRPQVERTRRCTKENGTAREMHLSNVSAILEANFPSKHIEICPINITDTSTRRSTNVANRCDLDDESASQPGA